MTHLIDKDAIVAEINNWIKDAKRRYTLSKVQFSLSDRIESLENLLSFLNTLEVKDDMDTIHPIEDVISNDPIANSYKEKYEQALEVAKKTYDKQPMYREWLEKMFTELKESEDEKIREALIRFHKSTIDIDGIKGADIISWLEKQGKCKTDCHRNHQDANYPNGCIVLEDFNGGEGFYKLNLDYLNKKQVEEVEETVRTWNKESKTSNENIKSCIGMCLTDANEQRFNDYNTTLKDCLDWLKKQGEQKFEMKTAAESLGVDSETYNKIIDECIYGDDKIEPKFKVGDKIYLKPEYRMPDDDTPIANTVFEIRAIDDKHYRFDGSYIFIEDQDKYELVEQKLSDEDMKELLRTEYEKGRADAIAEMQKEWSEEDEKILRTILSDGIRGVELDMLQVNWLKSLKGRVQPKQEWSEKDKDFMYDTLSNLTELKDRYGEGYGNVGKCIDWLKSLRPQNRWKPSDGQIRFLQAMVNDPNNASSESCQIVLKDILEKLKKLKEEKV